MEWVRWSRMRDNIPLLSTARHSSSDFCIGYDMFFEEELLKREPSRGIVGIDRRTVMRDAGARPCCRGKARMVVLEKAWSVRMMFGREKRIWSLLSGRDEVCN